MKTTFIYTLCDPETDEVRYIGKTTYLKQRKYAHIIECKSHKKSHKISWIKSLLFNDKKPSIEILDEIPEEEWEYWEKYWIEQFRQWGFNLTNSTKGGQGGNGYKHTNKTKKKMRHAKLGIPLTEEHKKKISNSIKEKAKEDPMYNRGEGNSRKPMDRDLLYKKYITENMSMPQLSNFFNVSEKKIFDELHHYDIKKEDGWWLKDLSDRYKKPVIQYDLKGNLLKEWDGIVDISNEFGYNKSNVANCCRNIIKTSNGFIWRYKNEWIDLPKIGKSKSKTHLPVKQFTIDNDLIKDYNSIKEAAKENNLRSDNIILCCEGKLKTHKGFIWEYFQEFDQ